MKTSKTQRRRDILLKNACQDGDLQAVRYHLTSPKLAVHANPNSFEGAATFSPLVDAVRSGHFEVVKYLVTSEELSTHSKILDKAFEEACELGHLEILRFFIQQREIREHPQLGKLVNQSAQYAANHGQLETMRELATSELLPIKADLLFRNDFIYRHACENGFVDIVRYVAGSSELKKHADLSGEDFKGFRMACMNSYVEVIDYLLIDRKLQVPEAVISSPSIRPEIKAYIGSVLTSRDLNDKLERSLPTSSEAKKRTIKI